MRAELMHPSVTRRYKGCDPKAQHATLRKTLKHVGLLDGLRHRRFGRQHGVLSLYSYPRSSLDLSQFGSNI